MFSVRVHVAEVNNVVHTESDDDDTRNGLGNAQVPLLHVLGVAENNADNERDRGRGEEGSNDASSDSWKFYLASSGIINYAPFPTELLAPRSGTTVTPLDGEIILSWAGSDVDGDLDYYELYLDETDASTFIKQIDAISTTTETSIEVQSETAYSWKIIAVDSNGNKSNSGIYTFRTD